ncbi:MAG: BMC domain-containing protein [Elusimicrobia bacterium]|nr:BMC domain-containing protein [Elusimicrobiota bacterium]
MANAIGLIELCSVAKGFEVSDALLKAAGSYLIEAHSVCPGKFIVLIAGETADVESSLNDGLSIAEDALVDKLFIPNIHPQLLPAIRGTSAPGDLDALGIIETFSASSAIIAADQAAKKADIRLIDVRLANALGGKGYLTLTGSIGSVRSAVNAGCMALKEEGILIRRVIIPQPHPDLRKSVM